MLAGVGILTVFTGYAQTAHLLADHFLASRLHRIFEWGFVGLLALHIVLSTKYSKIVWKKSLHAIKEGSNLSIHLVRVGQRISSWFILGFGAVVILSGLHGYLWFSQMFGDRISFNLHRMFDLALTGFMILHILLGFRFYLMRRHLSRKTTLYAISLLFLFLTFPIILVEQYKYRVANPIIWAEPSEGDSIVHIGENSYAYAAENITTLRPDLFKPGFFSLFDVLVHVVDKYEIPFAYHFDTAVNTHVIDTLADHDSWWYKAYYDGGWSERNVFRMDHYPWKEETYLRMYHESPGTLDRYYAVFRDEIDRKQSNSNQTIVPEVEIQGNGLNLLFFNVTVEPFNMRNETFQEGTLTALDIMLSLNHTGHLNISLQWYSSIGSADVVNDYWVESINGKRAHGTCGWVYEAGSHDFDGFAGNHIHIPSDYRIINSPEYSLWFWICL